MIHEATTVSASCLLKQFITADTCITSTPRTYHLAGAVPNVYWGAMTLDQLRSLGSGFSALPLSPHVAEPASYQ